MNFDRMAPRIRAILTATFFCLQACTVGNAAGEPISIIEPQNGSIVRPGGSVMISVEVDPSLLPGKVIIMGGSNAENPIGSKVITGPPYQSTIEIPESASGTLKLMVGFSKEPGGVVEFTDLSLIVVPGDAPDAIEATSSIRLIDNDPNASLSSRIQVTGIYPGGITRDVSSPALGTTYQSLTPDVVTVNESGQLTQVNSGYGYVLVENQGAKAFAQVIAERSGGMPPPQDRTGSVEILSSGFRRDPQSGLFVQQLTVKNTSTLPLPKAIRLVISDLPEGVALINSSNRTRYVNPVGANTITVQVDESDFLSPGRTGTATLKFSNSGGVPITYSRRLFCGGRL